MWLLWSWTSANKETTILRKAFLQNLISLLNIIHPFTPTLFENNKDVVRLTKRRENLRERKIIWFLKVGFVICKGKYIFGISDLWKDALWVTIWNFIFILHIRLCCVFYVAVVTQMTYRTITEIRFIILKQGILNCLSQRMRFYDN